MNQRRHFLQLEGMPRAELMALLERSREHRDGLVGARQLVGHLVANVFFEASTRTRASFEVAATSIGATVLNWNAASSSTSKGESLVDTVRNIAALGTSVIVLRHPHSGAAALVAQHVPCAVVNAGDGQHEHPSQGLLDAFTLFRRWGRLTEKRIAIIGDVLHSRVARSNIHVLNTLGASVTVCGPRTLIPKGIESLNVSVNLQLDQVLADADAVIVLRLQRERQAQGLFPSESEYHRRYGLTVSRLKAMRERVLVLHPGPMNRGVEIDGPVADGDHSLILEQVTNGVSVRKAILEAVS
jgi:aspartate carbamoyltransferase catalytic subunit